MNRGYACIALNNPKNQANIGGSLRAAQCFKANLVAVSGKRIRPGITDTGKAYRHIPLVYIDDIFSVLPFNCVPVAVELHPKARMLTSYMHPERAFYIFGAEDATLGQKILNQCRDIVQIPSTMCLNLAACVNVILYDRLLKRKPS